MSCSNSITTNFLIDISKFNLTSIEFVKKLKEKEILVTDASVFRVHSDDFIRVSVSNHEDNQKFIQVLSEFDNGD